MDKAPAREAAELNYDLSPSYAAFFADLYDFARKKHIPLSEAAAVLSATDEMKPKPRNSLRELMATTIKNGVPIYV